MADSVEKVNNINNILFELLREPLGLKKNCTAFTLTVEANKYPIVSQTYYQNEELVLKTDKVE